MPALYITGTSGTVIRGITFKNILTGACIGDGLCHSEGVYVGDNTGLLIDRNSFANIDVYDIFHSNGSIGVNGHETVTNNYFDCSNPYGTTIVWTAGTSDTIPDVLVRGNIFLCAIHLNTNLARAANLATWTITGNLFGAAECPTKPTGQTGAYDVAFVDNLGIVECRSSAGLIANGNQTIQQLGIGGGGGLWAEARARWSRRGVAAVAAAPAADGSC